MERPPQMHFNVKEGNFILQWPADISVESLALCREAVELQLKTVQRLAEERARRESQEERTP